MAQMGIANPLAPLPAYYQSLRKLAEAADLEPDMFLLIQRWQCNNKHNPTTTAQPETKQKMQKCRLSQKEAQDKLALQRDQNAQEAELARYKLTSEATIQRETAALKADLQPRLLRRNLSWIKKIRANRHMFRMNELEMERELEREKMIVNAERSG